LAGMFDALNHSFMAIGVAINAIVLFVISTHTPQSLRDYAIIIFNTALNDFIEMLLHFMLNPRIFIYGRLVAHVSDGPCRLVSDVFCGVLFEMIHTTVVHTCTLIAISFWYR
ncbi:hypothetical protein PMAYCL1PPCAC_26206, partial [Pristionchus mayeri]